MESSAWAVRHDRNTIYCGLCREITNLRWQDVDLEAGAINLPDSKTGPRKVHISQVAADTLCSIREHQHNTELRTDYVCPSPRDAAKPIQEVKTVWKALCKKAKIKGTVIHDLRHSFASTGVSGRISIPLIGGLPGHAQGRTTERYAYLANDPLREAAEIVGNSVAEAMSGGASIVEMGSDAEDTSKTEVARYWSLLGCAWWKARRQNLRQPS